MTSLWAIGELTRDTTGGAVEILAADVSAKSRRDIVEPALSYDPNITTLVNYARVGSVESIREADAVVMEAMINLNLVTLTYLTYATEPASPARQWGGHQRRLDRRHCREAPHGVCSASKSYLLSTGQLLQADLGARGVRLRAVLPRVAATEL